MEESRTQRLQQLLKRLGRAVQGSVVQSEEVRECLEELHEDASWSRGEPEENAFPHGDVSSVV